MLAPILAEHDGDAGRNVQALDRAAARDRQAQIRTADHCIAHALAFGAECEYQTRWQLRRVQRDAVARNGRGEAVTPRAQRVQRIGRRGRLDQWHDFRRTFGDAHPISFSAGVDAGNFADAVALGLKPVTVCSDLLGPGGYGRASAYFGALTARMKAAGAGDLETFTVLAHGRPAAEAALDHGGLDGEAAAPLGDMGGLTGGASGLGGIAGGIEGVIGSIVDGISGLIGALTGGLGDGSSDSPLDDPVDVDDPNEPVDEGVDDAEPVAADEPLAPEQPAEQLTESPPAAVEAVDEPAAPPPIGPPPADQPPPDDQPPPPTGLPPEGSTPCEIAEDQLPQAGQ